MELHYLPILVATVAQFIIGMIWYGPLFGKTWMKIHGADKLTPEEIKKTQKAMGPFYALQFVLTFLMTTVLATAMGVYVEYSPFMLAFYIWLGFMMPVQIGAVIWGADKKEFWLKKIMIMTGYQLVSILLATWIYAYWA
jgi:hypothetical protein